MAVDVPLFANFPRSTLASSVNSTQTSLTVAAGEGGRFPNPGSGEYFIVLLTDEALNMEYLRCTARATDALTVTREAEDAARFPARAWDAGDTVMLVTSAGNQELIRDYAMKQPGGQAESELTIAAGAITPTAGCHSVDTQGDAASDDLVTINTTHLRDGALLLLRAEHEDRTVTLKHGTGNIATKSGADVALMSTGDHILLHLRGGTWHEAGFWAERFEGVLAKDVTGGVGVALTEVEARNRVIELTGAITADIDVTLPATATGVWAVINATTGGHGVTLKPVGGAGVELIPATRGVPEVVYSDGAALGRAGAAKLQASTTVSLNSSMTRAEIQALIDAQPRNLNGYTLSFQFADGTYNASMTSALTFDGFRNGVIYIRGDLDASETNGLHTDQDVFLDFSGGTSNGLSIRYCSCRIDIDDLKIKVNSNAAEDAAIEILGSPHVLISYCYLLGNGTGNGYGIDVRYGNLYCNDNYFDNIKRAIYAVVALVNSDNNDSTGTDAVYGLMAQYASTIGKRGGNQPTGSTANESANGGGEIR